MIRNELIKEISIFTVPAVIVDLNCNIYASNDFVDNEILKNDSLFDIVTDSLNGNLIKLNFNKKSSFQLRVTVSEKICLLNFIPALIDNENLYIVTFNFISENPLLNTINFYNETELIETVAKKIIHDINNSIGGITGGLSLIEFKAEKNNYLNEISSYIETVNESVEKTINILKELNEITAEPQEFEEVNLYNVITDILSTFESYNFSVNLNLSETCIINTDKAEFKKIIINILNNSINSLKEKEKVAEFFQGKISIDSEIITLYDESSFCMLKITDNGIGINEKDIVKSYYPYFKTGNSKEKRGLGLTFSMLKSRNTGVILELSSKPGNQTKVVLYFPVIA